MKIDPILSQNILKTYQTVKKAAPKAEVAAPQDAVTVSDEAQSFSKVLAEAKGALAKSAIRSSSRRQYKKLCCVV